MRDEDESRLLIRRETGSVVRSLFSLCSRTMVSPPMAAMAERGVRVVCAHGPECVYLTSPREKKKGGGARVSFSFANRV